MAKGKVIWGGLLALGAIVGIFKAVKASAPPSAPAINVSNLSISPAQAAPGGSVNIGCVVTNIGGAGGSYTVMLGGDFMASKSITFGPGESQRVSFQVTAPSTPGTYNVHLDGLSGSFEVVSTPVADIELSDLVISPETIYPGDPITISATATNHGTAAGSKTITLS